MGYGLKNLKQILFVSLLVCGPWSVVPSPALAQATQFYLEDSVGSQWAARIYVVADTHAKPQVQESLYHAIDHARATYDKLNIDNPSGELSLINTKKTSGSYMVSPELAAAVAQAIQIAKETHGLFDITSNTPKGSYKEIKANTKNNEVKIKADNVTINLRYMLKGFLADLIAKDLMDEGWKNCFIKLGDVYAARGNDVAGPWKIPVATPNEKLAKRVFLYRVVKDISAGTVTRKNTPDLAIDTDLQSVTIFTSSAAEAQGLATAVTIMGSVEGKKFLSDNPGLRAVFAQEDGTFVNIPEFK